MQEQSKILSILGEFGEKVKETIKGIVAGSHKHYADCIILNNAGDVLLLQRSFQDDFMPGKWCLPGGKMESGENPTESAQRELLEETGLAIPQWFIKTIEKKDCTINYYYGYLNYDLDDQKHVIILDNDEHYRYQFVPASQLSSLDLILDLGEYLPEMVASIPAPISIEPEFSNVIEALAATGSMDLYKHDDIKKAYDAGSIEDVCYLQYLKMEDAIDTLKKAHGELLITDEQFFDYLEKAKHYQFVKVERDGKIFYQYREVGSDVVEDDIEVGDDVDTADLGLKISRYSDKSFLITGDTYKNLALLRDIKKELGYGSWNKTLNGWIFPSFDKDKIMGMLVAKMPEGTYDETIAKNAAIDLKNAVEPGTPVTVDGYDTKVNAVTTDVTGQVKYEVSDGDFLKDVTETEIGIPEATEEKAQELIGNVTEESRNKTGKELFGKQEGQMSDGQKIQEKIVDRSVIKVKEFVTRSGEKVEALDYSNVTVTDIFLSDVKNILNKPKPYFIPDINEYAFSGPGDGNFTFDYVRIDDSDNYLVALNGFDKKYSNFRNDVRIKDVDNRFAVMPLDVLVATTEYYKTKRKAELKVEADVKTTKSKESWFTGGTDIFRNATLPYRNLSDKQAEKITEEQWKKLSLEEKITFLPDMKLKPWKEYKASRISPMKENRMALSAFTMYKTYVDSNYVKPFRLTYEDPCVAEFQKARKDIEYKTNDLEMQKEETDSSFSKGRETSYGDSGTKDDLLGSHGVLVKRQNGDVINEAQITQIRESLNEVYKSFGDRSSMSKEFGLKISHAADKAQHAAKAIGIYFPYYRAIGVSDAGKFGFTLAHEYAHFFDNYLGDKRGYHYSSDRYNSTAGQIASKFRSNMNKVSESKYINRTCECFARALEQYHAMQTHGDDVRKWVDRSNSTLKYHEDPNHVSKDKFNTIIKPLIEQFLQENDHLLKSELENQELQTAIQVNDSFELIKSAFDADEISLNTLLDYARKYEDITKGDPTNGGKLVKKVITDKNGKQETKWITAEQKEKEDANKPKEFTTLTHNMLSAHAKETPEKELRRVISESHDPKLRRAAQNELDRRAKKEKPQDKKDAPVKKKDNLESKKDVDIKVEKDEPLDMAGKIAFISKNTGVDFTKSKTTNSWYGTTDDTYVRISDHPSKFSERGDQQGKKTLDLSLDYFHPKAIIHLINETDPFKGYNEGDIVTHSHSSIGNVTYLSSDYKKGYVEVLTKDNRTVKYDIEKFLGDSYLDKSNLKYN